MVWVFPGWEDVLAKAFRLINALIREDFPTFDFPAKANSGNTFSGKVLVIPQTVSNYTFLITITTPPLKQERVPTLPAVVLPGRCSGTASSATAPY